MKLLANENIPQATVKQLRSWGHDVKAISEFTPGILDEEVMRLAHEDKRILLTFDRDYGELVFVRHLPAPVAIIYMRFQPDTPIEPAHLLHNLLTNHASSVTGRFIVLDRDTFRHRPLPPSGH